MPQTQFLDTTVLPRVKVPGGGEMTEILGPARQGARNVVGTLRWLQHGERYQAVASSGHQLLYLMEGQGTITLDGKTHDVKKGMGLYLGPSESATVQAGPASTLKIFQLAVPRIPE
jgi:quercetin dioxygenase-like cupin family protein